MNLIQNKKRLKAKFKMSINETHDIAGIIRTNIIKADIATILILETQ